VSILLEALRKSEKSQRSRELPTIHSEVPGGPSSRSLKTGPLALLLVLTLVVCGWFVWQQYRSPDAGDKVIGAGAPASGVQNPSVAGDAQPSSPDSRSNTGQADDSVKSARPRNTADGGTLAAKKPGVEKNSQPARTRTPVEDYQAPGKKASNSDKPGSKNSPRPVKPKPDNTKHTVLPKTVPDQGSEAGTARKKTAKKEAPRPAVPELLGYWDLPDSIRGNVPEVKFSVLVYDKNPAARFVLIEGERLAEGDSHESGLVVKEIRRDGVVFSYRLYQFIIKK
jgi:general secretion pathway protein B